MSALPSVIPDAPLAPESFEVAPMSAAQRQLWFLQTMHPECRAYNIAAVFRVRGPLDVDALRRATRRLVERHEVLRTTFGLDDGQPIQKIAQHVPLDSVLFTFEDLEGLTELERTASIRSAVEMDGARSLDLERGPLFYCRVLRRTGSDHVLIVMIHHIISDGWSIGVLIRDLQALYAAEAADLPAELPELPIQYADYSVWQQQRVEQGDMEPHLKWWLGELQGAPTILQLPSDRPRPAVQSYRGAQHSFDLDAGVASELKRFCSRERSTVFMTLIAGFAALLYRYTGATDLLIGTPVANRPHKDLHGLIGCFVNAVVIRVQLSSTVTFRELACQVRRTSIAAFEHQELPFEQLVQALGVTPEPSHNPLFQVMFLLQNNEAPATSSAVLDVQECEGGTHSSRFDLSLSMEEGPTGVRGFWEYSSDLFELETIRRITVHFEALLTALLRAPERPVSSVHYLSANEISEIRKWSSADRAYESSELIHQLVERRAKEVPQQPAVVQGDRSITYDELNARANRVAVQLISEGVGLDDLVGICSERSIEWVIGLLGILKAGAGYLSLDPRYPADRLRFMIADAKPRLALAGDGLASLFQESGVLVRDLSQLAAQFDNSASDSSAPNPPSRGRSDSAAYAVYTSGSTGRPKAVVMCHGALLNLIHWHTRTYQITPQDRASQFSRMGFDASAWEIWPNLASGASVHIVDEQDRLSPKEVRRFLIEHEITISFVPPVIAESLLGESWPANTRLRALLTGSDRLIAYPPKGLPFGYYNHYGPTEAAVIVTAGQVPPLSDATAPPSIGRPLDNARILLLDDDLQLTPELRPSELYIGGVPLARGYLNRPALTAERFVPDPHSPHPGARMYRSGDLARFRSGGEVEFIGRNDRQVKIRGFRVELGEIEALMAQQPGIEGAAVVLHESKGQQQLAAYLVANGAPPADAALRAALRRSLPEFMIPAVFVYLDSFPVSPNGKLRREALPPIESTEAPVARLAPPRGDVEEKLAAIWREVLGRTAIGIHDNFFDIGGQSLTAVKVQDLLRQRLGVDVPIVELFRNATIAELAQYLGAGAETERPVMTGRSRADQRKELRAADRRRRRDSQGDEA